MRAVVLRGGKLEVRETADPVPGPGELLIKPLSAAICASDVHYMDHPNSATRFVWDSDRDTIMGHEFIGEVVGHGPNCSDDFPVGTRVTSLPIMIRHGEEPLVIGHHPDAPGAFGGLMLVSEIMARMVPNGVPERLGRPRRRFRGGRVLRSLLGDQAGGAAAGHRGGSHRPVDGGRAGRPRCQPDRGVRLQRRAACVRQDVRRRHIWSTRRRAIRMTSGGRHFAPTTFRSTQVIFECVGKQRPVADHRRLVRIHGARACRGRLVRRGHDRLHGGHAQGHDDPIRWRAACRRTGTARWTRSPTAGWIRRPASAGSSGSTKCLTPSTRCARGRARRASSFIRRPPHKCPGARRRVGLAPRGSQLHTILRRVGVQTRALAVRGNSLAALHHLVRGGPVLVGTHSRAKAATASVVVTPRITRLISPAGRWASALASRAPFRVEGFARDNRWSTSPALWASWAVRIMPGARKEQRLAEADQLDEPLGSAPRGHDLEGHLVEPDLDVVGGQPDVGRHRHLGATPERVPVERRDRRARQSRRCDRRSTASATPSRRPRVLSAAR